MFDGVLFLGLHGHGETTYQRFAQMIFLRDTGRIGTGANQRLYLGNRQSGLLMRLGSLSHLASDLLGLKNRPFERVVHAHGHFPAANGEYEVPRLAHAYETGFFKPIIWHIRTTFRRKDITSFKYAPRVELYEYFKSCILWASTALTVLYISTYEPKTTKGP